MKTVHPVDSLVPMREQINAVLRGKAEVVDRVIICLLARGHVLLEDMPGLGKTTLAKGLAQAIGCSFARVQCTPDLLPGDVTGFNLFNQKTREFEFQPGPIFADILLVDEINRATPRTQSALLEAMAEQQVTVDNVRRALPPTFFVMATQNPVDQHGTYPLPEAQLDRFAMRLSVGYPAPGDEVTMLADAVGAMERRAPAAPTLTVSELQQLQKEVANVGVHRSLQEYLVALATYLRNHPQASLGISPRALLLWQRTAQAWAFLQGRSFVTPDDIQTVAEPVLSVRLAADARAAARLTRETLEAVPVPVPA